MPVSEPLSTTPFFLRSKLLILTVLLIGIWIPFQFWYGVWFGRDLTDEQLAIYLGSDSKQRLVQHALSQIGESMIAGDPTVRQWYAHIAGLVDNPSTSLRAQAAWVMGQDNTSEIFHTTLLRNLKDPSPLVRRNSSLSLVKFKDQRAVHELRQMLSPWIVTSPIQGKATLHAELKQWVHENIDLVTITAPDGKTQSIRSEIGGQISEMRVKDGASVDASQPLLVLAANPEHAWEALRGLFLIGQESDLPWVQAYLDNVHHGEEIRAQAESTAAALRGRSDTPPEE
jgi:hypothetical protein